MFAKDDFMHKIFVQKLTVQPLLMIQKVLSLISYHNPFREFQIEEETRFTIGLSSLITLC